ncbi:sugar lactone lactonase YvrE [Deinococcus metalli]|uniref:Sugar lactone lactonase YvrE n=1 Tax=Deinococcus metalli TaxID=1141878 RepID=A0A7W8NPJ4_9DEIO|nr:L-dopachrome tautomerase-related protein [Deinococcus metalli]MBB5378034.1 sugar lactone lactonase YvrE [Deinococcus metalli]GHF53911.1 yellow [Deinococcus metalli]
MRRYWLALALLTAQAGGQDLSHAPLVQGAPLELVHAFRGHMPVGVAVNSHGRIFVSFPRWEDPVPYSIAELRGGREVPYPDAEINTTPIPYQDSHFIGVQGLTVDARDRLWVLDTGTFDLGPILDQFAPKLVGIDTATNRIIRTIRFPSTVVLRNTYLNDLRIDLRHGRDGVAYITDSGAKSGAGIIVVDLASGRSWRKLTGDATVLPVPGFVSFPDGQALLERPPGGLASPVSFASDSIAISPNGEYLYYAPVASRRLYAVPTAALRDEALGDAAVKAQVRDLGEKGVSDGLAEDTAGNIYTTNHELNAIFKRRPDGEFETVARDPRLIWPDTLSLQGGYLYVMNNQLNRQAKYHYGVDQRTPPYALFRLKISAQPVLLR